MKSVRARERACLVAMMFFFGFGGLGFGFGPALDLGLGLGGMMGFPGMVRLGMGRPMFGSAYHGQRNGVFGDSAGGGLGPRAHPHQAYREDDMLLEQLYMLFFFVVVITAMAYRANAFGARPWIDRQLAALGRAISSFTGARMTGFGGGSWASPGGVAASSSSEKEAERVLLRMRALPIVGVGDTKGTLSALPVRELASRLADRGIDAKRRRAMTEKREMVEVLLEDTDCSICVGEYEEGDLMRVLRCGHGFHVDCIDRWVLHKIKQGPGESGIRAQCPLCNTPI